MTTIDTSDLTDVAFHYSHGLLAVYHLISPATQPDLSRASTPQIFLTLVMVQLTRGSN